MTILAQLHQQFIDDCFSAIEPLHRENKNPSSFGSLAVKHGKEFYLVQGALIFNVELSKTPFSHWNGPSYQGYARLRYSSFSAFESLRLGT